MQIDSEEELQTAILEYEGTREAKPGTDEARRAHELNAAIQAYYARTERELKRGRP